MNKPGWQWAGGEGGMGDGDGSRKGARAREVECWEPKRAGRLVRVSEQGNSIGTKK